MKIENNEIRRMVLEKIGQELKESGTETMFIKAGEHGATMDILNCTHNGLHSRFGTMTAQYFFPPYDSAEEVQYFTALMVLSGKLDKTEQDVLTSVLAPINREVPCGLFEVYPDIGLVFKLTVPIPEDISAELLYSIANMTAGHAIAISSSFSGYI